MSLNGILSSALTSLQTNSAALRVVSNNVANMNTTGYARRLVNQEALSAGGHLVGVDISTVQRVVDDYLTQETLSASGASSRYGTQSSAFAQLGSLLGSPGDNNSLVTQLGKVVSALGQASQAPSASASRIGVLNSLQNLAGGISGAANSIASLRGQLDGQVGSNVGSVNSLIRQVYDLNAQARTAQAGGDTASAVLDQRDAAIQKLSQLVDVRVVNQPDGGVQVMTNDGIALVNDTYAQLSYTPGATGGAYGPISLATINPATSQQIGAPVSLDSHLSGGTLKGLIEMRDGALADMAGELGQMAQKTAQAFNQVHNANAAFPPPANLTGRNTGLLAGDALNFTGKSTIAVASSDGNLVSRVDVDFGAHTITVGGVTTSFTNTVGSFAGALNTALGGNGGASFSNGVLSINANGGNGIVIQDDGATPASRGGAGLSQFFGLNDVFTSSAPSILATGLSATDASGLNAGGQMDFSLRGPNGEVARTASVSITAGMSIGDVVTAMNASMTGFMTFTLGSDGAITATPATSYGNYRLDVTQDTTQRGATGLGFTSLFGIGSGAAAMQATGFSLTASLAGAPQRLAFAKPAITPASTVGSSILTSGDSRGALALQALGTAQQGFGKAGNIGAQQATLSDYAGAFYQDLSTRANAARNSQDAQTDRLNEAQSRQSSTSGVNLDEELSNMMMYQQAYGAGARMMTVVQQLYDNLMQIL